MQKNITNNLQGQKNWFSDVGWLSLAITALYICIIGIRPFAIPDEGRYSEIPREMIDLGEYIIPHLNYVVYFEKPPLFYWLQTISLQLFGYNEWAARFPTMFMAVFGCLIVYLAGRKLFDRTTGLAASIVLATTLMHFIFSRSITLDMTLSVCLTASLLCFLVGKKYDIGASCRRNFMWGMYIFAALAVMTKGLIGIVFPAMIIGSWIIFCNQWQILKSVYLPSGLLIFLVLTVPWHIAVQLQYPEFSWFYFMDQHFLRYATDSAGRSQAAWFFPVAFLIGFIPWITFLAQSIYYHFPRSWQNRSQDSLFLILWAALIFLFFNFSNSKLIPYILPMFPPLALLVGDYLAKQWNTCFSRGFKLGCLAFCLIFIIIAIVFITLPHVHVFPKPEMALIWLTIAGSLALITGLVTFLFTYRSEFKKALFAMIIGCSVFFLSIDLSVPYVDSRGVKELSVELKKRLQPGDDVVTYNYYYQDLPFYLKKRVIIVGWENELTFGKSIQDPWWMMSHENFWLRWQKPYKTMYVIMPLRIYRDLPESLTTYPIAQTSRDILLTNQEVKK